MHTNPSPPRHTVLVVDDDPHVCLLLGAVIRQLGCNAVTAPDGMAALATLNAGLRPSLIITDLQMPRLDGRGLIHGVIHGLGLRTLPICVFSGEPPMAIPGVTRVLSKPLELALLRALIIQHCVPQSAHREPALEQLLDA